MSRSFGSPRDLRPYQDSSLSSESQFPQKYSRENIHCIFRTIGAILPTKRLREQANGAAYPSGYIERYALSRLLTVVIDSLPLV